MSYYSDSEGVWNDSYTNEDSDVVEYEVKCNACHGSGMDRDEADCIPCEGYGSVINYVNKGRSG